MKFQILMKLKKTRSTSVAIWDFQISDEECTNYLKVKSLKIKMVKTLGCGIEVNEFELPSRYYIHFWKNTRGKSMNPFILLTIG